MEKIAQENSCYSTALLLKYALNKGFKIDALLKGIEDKRAILENSHEWIDHHTLITLLKNYEECGGDIFTSGVEITSNQVTSFQLLFLKIASLPFILKNYASHYEKKITPLIKFSAELKTWGVLDIVFRPKDKTKYSSHICDFNRGCTHAIGQHKKLRNFKLTEISCAARSDASECRYRVTWTPDPPFIEKFKEFFLFRFTNQKSILAHMENTHNQLQSQYNELETIKDFYGHVMANMQEGVVWLDPDGKITFVNKGFLTIVRIDNQEAVLGKSWTDFLSGDLMRDIGRDLLKESRESPGAPDSFDLMLSTSDNDERLGQTTCLWVESTQQKPGYLLTIRDITDKRTIERKLFAAENRYRSLYENSPALIVGLDLTGKFLYANPAMEVQSGYTEKELKAMNFSQLVAPDGSGVDTMAMLAQRTGGVNLQEMHYRTKDDQWKSVTLATFPLHDDKSAVIGLGGIGIDITETKRLNEMLIQTQRMELLGQLAGGLAHDFKNMLTVISGYTKLITKISDNEKIQSFAGNIEIATERAANLTRNLLTFSRGEEVRNEVFIVNDIVTEVAKLLPPVLGRSIKLSLEMPETKFRIKGDPGKVHQCLLNLSINARDAMKENGEGVLTIRVPEPTDPHWLTIEVADNGPGIPPNIIERIFDPFFTTKKKGEGTGLGLSVVYGIVKSHGGKITVDSRPAEGACFRIKLPLEGASLTPTGRTVLVVDNDVVMRSFCAEILLHQNYNALQFTTINECCEWIDKNRAKEAFGSIIVLISAQYHSIAEKPLNSIKEIITIWICKDDETIPGNQHFVLRQPFPPAALYKIIESVERKLMSDRV